MFVTKGSIMKFDIPICFVIYAKNVEVWLKVEHFSFMTSVVGWVGKIYVTGSSALRNYTF